MIRWFYIVPRLLVLAIVGLLLWFGTAPLVHWTLQRGGQMLLGAKLDIRHTHADVWNGQLTVHDVQVANPRQPMKNLFQFDSAAWQIDQHELLKRRVLVRNGSVHGLRLDTVRETSGAIPSGGSSVNAQQSPAWKGKIRDQGERWLGRLGQTMNERLTDEFESVRLAKELAARWPREYDQLKQRSEQVEASVRDLRGVYERLQANPLAEVENLQKTLGQLRTLREEIVEIQNELPRLKKQVLDDRHDLDKARRADMQRIREIAFHDEVDPRTLTNYLLGPELSASVAQWIGYVQRGRQLWDLACKEPEIRHVRGADVVLPGMLSEPGFLIQRLAIDGSSGDGERRLNFDGTVRNLTNRPQLHGKPALIQISASGSAEFQMEVAIDRTGPTRREHLQIRCPACDPLPAMVGNADQLAVGISAAPASLLLVAELRENDLTGTVHIQQADVKLQPHLGPNFGGKPLAARVQKALMPVQSLDTRIVLGGTLRKPTLELQSDLGGVLASGFRQAIDDEIEHQKQRLEEKTNLLVDQQLRRAETVIEERKQQILQRLRMNQEELETIQGQLAGRIGLPGNVSEALLNRKDEWMQKLFR